MQNTQGDCQRNRVQISCASYISWASIVFVAVTVGSAIILATIPSGENFSHSDLWPGKLGFSDTPDKIVFLFWIFTLTSGWLLALTIQRKGRSSLFPEQSYLNAGLVLTAIVCIYVCMVFPDRLLGFWQGIPIALLILVQLLTIFLLVLIDRGILQRWLINLTAVSLAGIYLISAGFQTPSHIRDAYHSTIVLNDALAQAAGQIPLGNAMANYTALLGWPLKVALDLFSINPISAGLWYLLILQLATVIIAISLVLNRKTIPRWGLIILVAVSWIVLDPNQSGQTMLQSIAIAPARLLLPFITILIFLRFNSPRNSFGSSRVFLILLGVFSFLSAVNNVEFGLTIWTTSLLLLIFIPSEKFGMWIKVLFFSLGNALAFVGLALLMVANGFIIHLDWLITIPLLYASAGFDLLAMPTIGVHLYVAALFIASSIAGLLIARRSSHGSHEMHLGIILASVGTWSALSLTYFAGRSVSAALISGYGLQLGIISAVLVGYVTINYNDLGLNRVSFYRGVSITFVTLPVAISLSLYFIGADPRATLAYGLAANSAQQDYDFTFPGAVSPEESDFYEALEGDSVGQTVFPANIRALATGVSSVARAPEQLSVSRAMGRFECENNHDFSYWIVPQGLDVRLLTVKECADRWLPTGIIGLSQDGKTVSVLQRNPASF